MNPLFTTPGSPLYIFKGAGGSNNPDPLPEWVGYVIVAVVIAVVVIICIFG